MKKIIILLCVFILISCTKGNHSIRLKNYLSVGVKNIKFGTVQIGSVDSGAISDYYPISIGDFLFQVLPIRALQFQAKLTGLVLINGPFT